MRKGEGIIEVGGARAEIKLELDGTGEWDIDSGSGFLDHILGALAKMGEIDVSAKAEGGVAPQRARAFGLALGAAFAAALGDKRGIKRYGWAAVPMDEAVAKVALDLSGRAYLVTKGEFCGDMIADLATQDVLATLSALAVGGSLTLNVEFDGGNDHHKAESIFKALGLAFKEAKKVEGKGVLSTKGVL